MMKGAYIAGTSYFSDSPDIVCFVLVLVLVLVSVLVILISFDCISYLKKNGLPVPTAATIMLGDNDLSGASTDVGSYHFCQCLPGFQFVCDSRKMVLNRWLFGASVG
jgi:hypothetical protein